MCAHGQERGELEGRVAGLQRLEEVEICEEAKVSHQDSFLPRQISSLFFCPQLGDCMIFYFCLTNSHKHSNLKQCLKGFPGGPVVKNPPSNAGGRGSIPGGGTKIQISTGQLSLSATGEAHTPQGKSSAAEIYVGTSCKWNHSIYLSFCE